MRARTSKNIGRRRSSCIAGWRSSHSELGDGGPHYLVGNTIHGNAWNGLDVAREHVVWLVNTAITGNGTATGSTGGRFGVKREGSTNPQPAGIRLLNNLVCGNRLGELNGPILDPTDGGNRTPTGSEGSGVTASLGCDLPSNVYANLAGPDGHANTNDDDLHIVTPAQPPIGPASSSPVRDRAPCPRRGPSARHVRPGRRASTPRRTRHRPPRRSLLSVVSPPPPP